LIEPLVTRLRWQAGLSTKQTNVCLLGGKALWRFPLHDRPPEVASFCLFFPVYFILCFFTLHHHGVPSNTIDTHLRKKFKRNRTSRGQSTSPCFSSQVVLLYTRAISSEHKTVSAWRGYRIKGVHNWIAKSLFFSSQVVLLQRWLKFIVFSS
jgi:hypothetical protein